MFPDRAPQSPDSERVVYEALSDLSDEWLVFHSVAWQSKRNGRQGDGEADFVLVHPKRGLTVVEVKGGSAIEVIDGRWHSRSRGQLHSIPNPFEQVVTNKYPLREYIADKLNSRKQLSFGHAVCFPFVEQVGDMGPEAPRQIIWDRYDLRDIDGTVTATTRHWDGHTRFDDQQVAKIRKALAPTITAKRTLRHRVEEVVEELIELTEEQARVLGFLRRQRRALILGGAGTGKTVLAQERARQLLDDGFRVALLCFNAPLGDELADDFDSDDNIVVGNFHKIARGLCAEADRLPDGDYDQQFWDIDLPNALPEAVEALGAQFDAVIVDEGQDFPTSWFTALQLCMSDPDDGLMYVFADTNQGLYREDWQPPFDGEPFELDINCRNTRQIATAASAMIDREEQVLEGADGPAPKVVAVKDLADITEHVAAILDGLLNVEGLGPHQVVVLSSERGTVDALRGEELSGWKLVAPGREGVVTETIHRFKGLEADVAVVHIDELEDDRDRALAYVGMSRAKAMLFVLTEIPLGSL